MKQKLFTLLLVLVASFGMMHAEIYSGTCGDDLTWSLNTEDSTLTIEGYGAMNDYDGQYSATGNIPPWYGDMVTSDHAKNIKSVILPNGLTNLGDYAFADCINLGSITIPSSVTSIGDRAFNDCSGLTFVTIPNSIMSIGKGAFEHCTGLSSIEIPNSITSIEENVFLGCTGLTSVTIPNSVTSIGGFAFYGCAGLTSIEIPNSVTSIGSSTFSYCSSLTSIVIPSSVTSIGDGAFSRCTGLSYIEIPNSITGIENSTFSYCTGLTSITIPNSIISIGNAAFWECANLTSITIPENVTSIGDYAFYNCGELKAIYTLATTPPVADNSSFNGIHSDAIVYVPFGCYEAYKSAIGWKFLSIQRPTIQQSKQVSSSSCIIIFDVERTMIASVGIEGGEQVAGNTLEYIGLEPNSEYNNVPIVLTSNTGETETVNVSFTTTALSLTTQPSQPVSSNTAILLAQTNMADIETSCGFEWKRNDAPADMAGNKVYAPVANGTMAGRLKNLNENVYYKYRAFYQSATGNMYYGDWQYIFTGDVAVEFDPILYTYAAAAVTETSATLKGYALAGSDDFTEQGFEYWSESRVNAANAPFRMPAALGEHHTVTATGISMRVSLTDLDAGTVYRYRSYAKIGDQIIYGSEMTFTTQGTYVPPTYIITFVNWDGSELLTLPEVEEETLPVYTGDTPVRPEDDEYTYTFNGWSPAIVIATADATYTATYAAQRKNQAVDNVESVSQVTKILRDGQILILRGEKVYTLTGQEIK
ncbi:MAG: leucine-rich repeat protein [Paludibacteraceae bacterium]|nr:leucine-rich repeat protein [Paludibacteraceae bacterium]